MDARVRFLRLVHILMLISICLYFWLGEWIKKQPETLDPAFLKGLAILALITGGVVLFVRVQLLSGAEEQLRLQSDNTAALQRWNFLYILSFALSESIALYGIALRVMGASRTQAAGFYVGAIALMLLSTPHRP